MDFASATPVLPAVVRVVAETLSKFPGNPSASHEEGRHASGVIQNARKAVASTLFVKPEEIVFTAGGTEANNIAIRGVVEALRARGCVYSDMHIITSTIEHSSILESLRMLEDIGVLVTYITPESDGIVNAKKIIDAVTKKTVLITLAHVNSEIGTIQPLSEIGTLLALWRKNHTTTVAKIVPECLFPIFHADCSQSPLYVESGPHVLKVGLATYDAQKVMGPKGVGILYRDFSIPLSRIYGGGSQERGLRPGTENVAGIAGAAVAFVLAKKNRIDRTKKISMLRDYLVHKIKERVPDARYMGHAKKRIANNAHFAISGVDGDYLTVLMDSEGIAVSPRSACVGGGGQVSHVIQSITGDSSLAKGTIRFSLGSGLTKKDVDIAVLALERSLVTMRG
jgi:cysteine desulfurase